VSARHDSYRGLRETYEEESRHPIEAGTVREIASHPVVSVAQTTPILNVIETMTARGFRRIVVVSPGNMVFRGLVSDIDILRYLGGEGMVLIRKKYKGNLMSALNSPVNRIMRRDIKPLKESTPIDKALEIMMKTKRGGYPIVDSENYVTGIVTLRDVITKLSYNLPDVTINEIMSTDVLTIPSTRTFKHAIESMLKYGFRRLPVVEEEKPIGVISSRGIIKFIGGKKIFKISNGWLLSGFLSIPVTEAMHSDYIIATPESNLINVVEDMKRSGWGSVFILGPRERLVGLLTEYDVFKLIYKKISAENE